MKVGSLFILYALFCIPLAHSQSYKPIDTADTALRKENALRFDQKMNEYMTALKDNYSSKVSSKITADFKAFSKDFTKEINDGSFVFDKRFNDYVNGILAHLRENNAAVPANIDILIAKNNSLNAFCIPNNTFVLNMGLFYLLENEEQVAAVISHELGHKILEHTTKNKKKAVEEANSNQTKQDIRTLALTKYGKYDQAFELFKSKLYVSKESQRKQEFEADSLGYEIYRKSKYAKSEFLSALNLMARYDTINPKGLKIEIYKKMFDLPNQKFDEKWLLKEDFSKYNYDLFKEKIDKDSISTHPEMIDRIARIATLFP
ncbi:MAG: M48 family metallopeptidase, partial [Bacteroidota bacterium]